MSKTYIIAEVGPNHNGSIDLALKYIEELSDIGVDAVKFQLTNPKHLFSENSIFAEYQKKNNQHETPQKMASSHQLSYTDHFKLYEKCLEKNVDYLCTAFDLESLKFLNESFDLKYFKIASGEIFSIDMLEYISNFNKPIILSTGMAEYNEIKVTLKVLNKNSKKNITILHCISNYPTKIKNINLNVMTKIREIFGCPVGFSDHTEDTFTSLVAVSMGAKIIEKHVTFDKKLQGPDHKASSTIDEFKKLVEDIRKIIVVQGTDKNLITIEEKEIANVARKSIVAKSDLDKETILLENHICFKRPGTGILPIYKDKITGKKLKNKILKNHIIRFEDLY